jgi:hypothetical protein
VLHVFNISRVLLESSIWSRSIGSCLFARASWWRLGHRQGGVDCLEARHAGMGQHLWGEREWCWVRVELSTADVNGPGTRVMSGLYAGGNSNQTAGEPVPEGRCRGCS